MVPTQRASAVAGIGAVAFGALTVVGAVLGGAPGGNYAEGDVANYVSIGHLPTVILTGYLALVGVFGLICLFAYLRQAIGVETGREFVSNVFWGTGLASTASFAVGWGLVSGIAVAAAEGGSAASVPHAATYQLSDANLNVIFGSGGILFGFALIVLMIGSRDALPAWLRWLTLICGVLAIGAPAYFPAAAIPIWCVVMGVWLLVTGRAGRPVQAAQLTV